MENKFLFMREETADEYGIKTLQDKILQIMVHIDQLCKKNNITYYLMGGSALGAARHQGFIPWDDDIDIFIPAKDFLWFQKCCEDQLDTNVFYLEKCDSKDPFNYCCKLRMNNTAYIEEGNKNRPEMHQGIFVDIICLNNAAPLGIKRIVQYYCAGLIKAKAVSQTNYKHNSIKKTFQLLIANIIVRGIIKKILFRQVTKYNGVETKDVSHVFGRAKFANSFYPAEDFKSQRYMKFEKVELAVPNGIEDYLTLRYGADYMQLPSEETKKMYGSHATAWSVNEDYSVVLKRIENK